MVRFTLHEANYHELQKCSEKKIPHVFLVVGKDIKLTYLPEKIPLGHLFYIAFIAQSLGQPPYYKTGEFTILNMKTVSGRIQPLLI